MERRRQQQENMRICGDCYNQEHRNCVFVDPMGNLYTPQTVSSNFAAILKKNGLRKIRFHDLRHGCASLLLANDVPMKQIQEWLGHSDISTTANIYSHLDYKSKIVSAIVMGSALALPAETKGPEWVVNGADPKKVLAYFSSGAKCAAIATYEQGGVLAFWYLGLK